MKSTQTAIKNSIGGEKGNVDTTEERIGQLEDRRVFRLQYRQRDWKENVKRDTG